MIRLAVAWVLLAVCAWGEPVPIDAALARARPRPAEERWRSIAWGRSLRGAFATARKQRKPVFYFAYDGVLGSGNC